MKLFEEDFEGVFQISKFKIQNPKQNKHNKSKFDISDNDNDIVDLEKPFSQ